MNLPTFDRFFELTQHETLSSEHDFLKTRLQERLALRPHGRSDDWDDVLNALPQTADVRAELARPSVRLSSTHKVDRLVLERQLQALKPWRKGPFNLFGLDLDTEWRSDWKWARLQNKIQPLAGKAVLDIGCGNGYYLYRMLGDGARLALGIDPTRLFCYQFQALQRLQGPNNAAMLPLIDEDLPDTPFFDTVFSMGVLYHRRDPIDHLNRCKQALAKGGELVLETLIIPNGGEPALKPEPRYAKMRNVWEVPSLDRLLSQLKQAGFDRLNVLDVTQTSVIEQRQTPWMAFQSLADFLDPSDPNKTIEGYPAPLRAIISARRPLSASRR